MAVSRRDHFEDFVETAYMGALHDPQKSHQLRGDPFLPTSPTPLEITLSAGEDS